MGLISVIGGGIVDASKKVIFKGEKHSPEILVYGGVALGIYSAVEACRSTLKAEEVLNEAKKDFETIKRAEETCPERYDAGAKNRDLIVAYTRLAVQFLKLYGKPIAFGALSIFCILKGHGILRRRHADLLAYAVGLERSYKALYDRVSSEFSEEAAGRFASGIRAIEKEVEETDGNGKTKKKKKMFDIIGGDDELGPYEWIFGPDSNQWTDNFDYNLMWIKSQMTNTNDILIRRTDNIMSVSDTFAEAHLFNCPRKFYAAGWKLPWRYYMDTVVPYVQWDITKVYKDYNDGEGPVPVLKVNFNCDGYIWDQIPE